MFSSIRAIQLTLVFLFAVGYYGTWYLIMNNGATDVLGRIMAEKTPLLPGTEAPLKQIYTGVGFVDKQLTILTLFFWEIVDGSLPVASLQAFQFAGQIGAAWGLIMIEGTRRGNRWRLVSFTMFWGVLFQNFTIACIMPIYMVIHLSTSTTVQPSKSSVSMPSSELVAIPIALTIGFVIPTVLTSLPAPSIISFNGKQNLVAFWQAFPVWVAMVQQLLVLGFRISGCSKKADSYLEPITTLRCVYTSLLSLASLTHLSTLSAIFASSYFSKATSAYSISSVFIPSTISASTKMFSIGQANRLLLQYDNVVSCTAILLWASFLGAQARKRSGSSYPLTDLILRVVALTLTTGPMGCAVIMMWSRDELIWREGNFTEKKSK